MRKFLPLIFLLLSSEILISCDGRFQPAADLSFRAQNCVPVDKPYTSEEVIYSGVKGGGKSSYNELRNSLNSACMSCHQAPSRSGGFTYIDAYLGSIQSISGENKYYPGFSDVAAEMAEALLTEDPKKQMPPADRREKNPQSFVELGKKLKAWIAAGKPQGGFVVGNGPNPTPTQGPLIPQKPKLDRRSDLGDCVPTAKIIGFDYKKDREFENMKTLPKDLSDTDLFSLDNFELAQKGTVSYNVEYPLWADNADKGRFIHVPYKIENGKLLQKTVVYNPDKQDFSIPENTRFYKTFYKKIRALNGEPRYKRIETRIIVVRYPQEKSLVGSYKWDEDEQSATLIETPYRDGTPFKDTLYTVVVDEKTLKTRDYAVPGSQRCLDCHAGAPQRNFIIGFTPLQLNRRSSAENFRVYSWEKDGSFRTAEQKAQIAKDSYVSPGELSQLQRFIDYKLIQVPGSKIKENQPWPVLEKMGSEPARNEYELRAQGYFTGNCAHCHNPYGLAFNKENNVTLNLMPGHIFGFNNKTRSTQIPTRLIVHQAGDLDQSHIYRKVSDSSAQLGITSQMPMNTPGSPDCKVLRVVGKWVRSFESEEAAKVWEPICKAENPWSWVDQDFTSVESKDYVPRRADWKDSVAGMPEKYRKLRLTPELEEAILKDYAVGYWNKKEECQLPEKTLSAEETRPWMMKGKVPKRPFGEVYYTSPASWYYRTSCQKCHGSSADGNSALAKGILNWSGGSVRVANFMGGMFGQKTENLKVFNTEDGRNLGPNYLIWMAMEGTRVQFPPELSGYLGKHGAQMLNQMREKCLNQISSEKTSTPLFMDHEIFNKVCFVNNRTPGDPSLAFDPSTGKPVYPEIVEQWLDQAANNIGFAIFEYLKEAALGNWKPGNDQCEKLYPKPSAKPVSP